MDQFHGNRSQGQTDRAIRQQPARYHDVLITRRAFFHGSGCSEATTMKLKPIYLLLATVIISWLGATANAQTIADLARRERERKKGDESKAVLTNATAAAAKASQSSSVTTGNPPAADKDKGKDKESQAAGAKPAAPGVQTDNKGRDEKYWRAAFDKAR